jgi:hypothetical protein
VLQQAWVHKVSMRTYIYVLIYICPHTTARYHTCCNGRGCTKCYFSLDSMLPNKVLIDVSSYYYYICVLIRLLYMCPHTTTMYVSSMLPNKVLIDHAHRVSGRASEREEDDMHYAEEDDGNHTRFILHYDELKDEVVDSLSGYLYVCVLMPLCMSPHTSIRLSPHASLCTSGRAYVSSYLSI